MAIFAGAGAKALSTLVLARMQSGGLVSTGDELQ